MSEIITCKLIIVIRIGCLDSDAIRHTSKYNARVEMTCSGFKIKTSIELPWSGDRRTARAEHPNAVSAVRRTHPNAIFIQRDRAFSPEVTAGGAARAVHASRHYIVFMYAIVLIQSVYNQYDIEVKTRPICCIH